MEAAPTPAPNIRLTISVNNSHPPVCDYEGSDYQATFWEQGNREYEDQVEAIALQRLLPASGRLLLELGAGAGRNTPRYHGYERIVLLDYSISQLKLARRRLGAGQRHVYVAADIYRLPFVPRVFDGATMIRTLHHMADAPAALHQVRQTLHAGATFILEYANKQNLKAILRYCLRRQSWSPFSLEPVEFTELNFDFHPRAIRTWLSQTGFAIERQLTVSHFRLNLLKKTIPTAWLVGLDSLAQWTGDWWQLTPSVFLRAVATGDDRPADPDHLFKCPVCEALLPETTAESLICATCGSQWAIEDGIYNFKAPL